jgi:hypothetical protein
MPTQNSQGSNINRVSNVTTSDSISDDLNHHKTVTYNNSLYKIQANNYMNTKNLDYLNLHDSIVTNENRELFDINLLVTNEESIDSECPIIQIQFNKNCMTDLKLLDDKPILCLFDTGSNVNLICESVYQNSAYLQSLPIRTCPKHRIFNTNSHIETDKFIEVCFRIKDHYIMQTTALIVPDFGNVKFILSSGSMTQLKSVIDMSDLKISVHKKSFLFKTFTHINIKPHESILLPVKCSLPKHLREGEFLCRAFRPFIQNLPESFLLKFHKGNSFLKMVNPTGKTIHIPANKPLGSVNFNLTKDFTNTPNILSHYHTDLDKSISFCTMTIDECPIVAVTQNNRSDSIKHVQNDSMPLQYANPLQQHKNSTKFSKNAKLYMNHSITQEKHVYTTKLTDKFTSILEQYYKYDQDKMTAIQIYDLKRKTFPYLPSNDLRLKMPDRVIIDKDLDLLTDSILSPKDREIVKNLYNNFTTIVTINMIKHIYV